MSNTTSAGDEFSRSSSLQQFRLVTGVELLGEYDGPAFTDRPGLVRRPDGQLIQISSLLYALVCSLVDAADAASLSAAVSGRTGRDLSAENVEYLVTKRLAPLGLVRSGDSEEATRAGRSKPLLALRYRSRVVPERVHRGVTMALRPLFHPPLVVAALGALLAADVAVALTRTTSVAAATRQIASHPSLILMVTVLLFAAAAFHEVGHATAARYGGATPGVMGVGIYLVWPVFYTDLSDVYRLDRRSRLRADLGGVYFQSLTLLAGDLAYLGTHFLPLLVFVVVGHGQTLYQFTPFVRMDGYWILSDLVGVPNLFAYLAPVLASLRPGADPRHVARLARIRPWARRVIAGWVLFTMAVLAVNAVIIVLTGPRILKTDLVACHARGVALLHAVSTADVLAAVDDLVSLVLLAVPALGIVMIAALLTRRATRTVLRWWPDHRARATALGLVTLAAVGLFAFEFVPNEISRPLNGQSGGSFWVVPPGTSPRPRPVATARPRPGAPPQPGGSPSRVVGQAPVPLPASVAASPGARSLVPSQHGPRATSSSAHPGSPATPHPLRAQPPSPDAPTAIAGPSAGPAPATPGGSDAWPVGQPQGAYPFTPGDMTAPVSSEPPRTSHPVARPSRGVPSGPGGPSSGRPTRSHPSRLPASVATPPLPDAPAPVSARPIAAPPLSGRPIAAPPLSGRPIVTPPVTGRPISSPVSGIPISSPPVAGRPTAGGPGGLAESAGRLGARSATFSIWQATSRLMTLALRPPSVLRNVRSSTRLSVVGTARVVAPLTRIAVHPIGVRGVGLVAGLVSSSRAIAQTAATSVTAGGSETAAPLLGDATAVAGSAVRTAVDRLTPSAGQPTSAVAVAATGLARPLAAVNSLLSTGARVVDHLLVQTPVTASQRQADVSPVSVRPASAVPAVPAVSAVPAVPAVSAVRALADAPVVPAALGGAAEALSPTNVSMAAASVTAVPARSTSSLAPSSQLEDGSQPTLPRLAAPVQAAPALLATEQASTAAMVSAVSRAPTSPPAPAPSPATTQLEGGRAVPTTTPSEVIPTAPTVTTPAAPTSPPLEATSISVAAATPLVPASPTAPAARPNPSDAVSIAAAVPIPLEVAPIPAPAPPATPTAPVVSTSPDVAPSAAAAPTAPPVAAPATPTAPAVSTSPDVAPSAAPAPTAPPVAAPATPTAPVVSTSPDVAPIPTSTPPSSPVNTVPTNAVPTIATTGSSAAVPASGNSPQHSSQAIAPAAAVPVQPGTENDVATATPLA